MLRVGRAGASAAAGPAGLPGGMGVQVEVLNGLQSRMDTGDRGAT